MGAAPENLTIERVQEDGKVIFQNVNNPCDVTPKDTPVAAGTTLRGWLNLDGKYGPYFKVAEERQSASNGARGAQRDEAMGISIEAQVSAYAASYVLAAHPLPDTQAQVAERIEFLTSAFFSAIQHAKGPETQTEIPDAPPF